MGGNGVPWYNKYSFTSDTRGVHLHDFCKSLIFVAYYSPVSSLTPLYSARPFTKHLVIDTLLQYLRCIPQYSCGSSLFSKTDSQSLPFCLFRCLPSLINRPSTKIYLRFPTHLHFVTLLTMCLLWILEENKKSSVILLSGDFPLYEIHIRVLLFLVFIGD